MLPKLFFFLGGKGRGGVPIIRSIIFGVYIGDRLFREATIWEVKLQGFGV